MEKPSAKDNETTDPDYSLNELFNKDWNASESDKPNVSAVTNTESQASSCGATGCQDSDLDYSLNDCFDEEWTYNPPTIAASTSTENSKNSQQNILNNRSNTKERISSNNLLIVQMIEKKDTKAFNKLLSSKYELAALNEKGQTALHLIFYNRAWNLLDLLDKKFSSCYYSKKFNKIDLTDSEGLTHLHVACIRGSLSLVQRYLTKNNVNDCYSSEPSDICSGFSPLHFAATNPSMSKVEIIIKLIELGANVNAVDSKGRTPLHIASGILIKEKHFIFSLSDMVKSDCCESIYRLIKAQSNCEARDSDGNTPVLSIFSSLYYKLHADPYAISELHVSTHMLDIKKKIKFYLEFGVDMTVSNKKNENILHLILTSLVDYRKEFENANYIFDDNSHIEMIKQILSTSPSIDLNLETVDGKTPLQMAVACMSPKIVEVLLNHGVDLTNLKFEMRDSTDKFFYYPNMVLIFEPLQDLINVLNLLLDRGFNWSFKDKAAVLSFLYHDDLKLECACRFSNNNKNEFSNLKYLLHYGHKDHAESIIRENYEYFKIYNGSGDSEEMYIDLSEYLDTIKFANIYCNEDVVKKVTKTIGIILREWTRPTLEYTKNMEKDLNKLKNIKFENGMSLHDILKENPRNIPRMIVDEFDLKLIESLHCYKDAIEGHITKARVRFIFENYATDYLKKICECLPHVCCLIIINYLSDKDISKLGFAIAASD